MSKFRRKFKWKNILSFVLVGVLLVGSVAGLGAVFNKDTKTISSTAFAVGGINAQGNYEKTDLSIYTKDMFECKGLSIEPNFEATGTYKVFYYDENKNFIVATNALNSEDGTYNKGDTYTLAKYARVMITPDVPTDDEGNEVEDFKIRFYEVTSYASDYKITVAKKQSFKLSISDYTALKIDEGNGITKTVGSFYEPAKDKLTENTGLNVYKYEFVNGANVFVGGDYEDITQFQFVIRRVDGTYVRYTEASDIPTFSSPYHVNKGDIVYINVSSTASTSDLVLYVSK